MFLVILTYAKPLTEVDHFLPEHRAFLERHYASGHFLLSGRREPREGGVILATASSRAELEDIIRQDPFHREELADYKIIEFLPTLAAPHLEPLKNLGRAP